MSKNNFLALDLEMNQPSNRIIQIGAVAGNLYTGEIFGRISRFVNPGESLNPDITALTGIGANEMIRASSLEFAFLSLKEFAEHHDAQRNVITWGDGDVRLLKSQMKFAATELWPFGNRTLDAKTLYQFFCIAHNKPRHGGLKPSMLKLGLSFEGPAHRADYDALNTFRFAYYLMKQIKER